MMVTLKLATSLDGRIATASGESRWITGPAAREQVHRLRAMHAGVLVGVETVIADDPELTVRLAGYVGAQPARIVMDSQQRIPLVSKLVTTSTQRRTIVVSVQNSNNRLISAGGRSDNRRAGRRPRGSLCGFARAEDDVRLVGDHDRRRRSGRRQLYQPATSLTPSNGSERRSCSVARADRRSAPSCLNALGNAPRFRRISAQAVGEDLWERYVRA